MKLSISINDELLREIDEYCKVNFMTRSGLISFACTQVLNQQKTIQAMQDVALALRQAANNTELDPETLAQVEAYEQLVKPFGK